MCYRKKTLPHSLEFSGSQVLNVERLLMYILAYLKLFYLQGYAEKQNLINKVGMVACSGMMKIIVICNL